MKKFVFLLLLFFILGGCGIFRRKNRCHTCPTWKTTTFTQVQLHGHESK